MKNSGLDIDLKSAQENVPWEEELDKRALKIHVLACKVSVIAVPAFFITDVIISPDRWKEFLILRLIVALLAASLLVVRKWVNVWQSMLVFIPFTTISLLNAYMWSRLDIAGLQMHSFSYIALFLAGGMLLLWRSHYTKKVVLLSLLFNVLTFYFFSSLSFSEIMSNGGALTMAVAFFSVVLMDNRYKATKEEIISRLLLNESKLEIEEKNKEILDSISYAQRIQEAILPPNSLFKSYLPASWVLYKPKDIVAGDFYWIDKVGDEVYFAVADCTGHGVPGAMVSMVCANALNKVVGEMGINEPSLILDHVRNEVVKAFEKSEEEVKDGMDIAFCKLNLKRKKLTFSGAHGTLYVLTSLKGEVNERVVADDNNMIQEFKGDRQPIGKFLDERPFRQIEIQLQEGDIIYLTSDGFPDQFGGDAGKKYMSKRFKKLLLSFAKIKDIEDQKTALLEEFESWKGQRNQIDDVCVMGVKV